MSQEEQQQQQLTRLLPAGGHGGRSALDPSGGGELQQQQQHASLLAANTGHQYVSVASVPSPVIHSHLLGGTAGFAHHPPHPLLSGVGTGTGTSGLLDMNHYLVARGGGGQAAVAGGALPYHHHLSSRLDPLAPESSLDVATAVGHLPSAVSGATSRAVNQLYYYPRCHDGSTFLSSTTDPTAGTLRVGCIYGGAGTADSSMNDPACSLLYHHHGGDFASSSLMHQHPQLQNQLLSTAQDCYTFAVPGPGGLLIEQTTSGLPLHSHLLGTHLASPLFYPHSQSIPPSVATIARPAVGGGALQGLPGTAVSFKGQAMSLARGTTLPQAVRSTAALPSGKERKIKQPSSSPLTGAPAKAAKAADKKGNYENKDDDTSTYSSSSGGRNKKSPDHHKRSGTSGKDRDSKNKKRKRQYNAESFVQKLFRMVTDMESKGKRDVIEFLEGGGGFWLHKPDVIPKLMPEYDFRGTKFSGFRRQLTSYGFRRERSGTEKGAYKNDYFVRGCPELCERILRDTSNDRPPIAVLRRRMSGRGSGSSSSSSDSSSNDTSSEG